MTTELIPQAEMTPKQIVAELDHFIIGQLDAKKKVSIALRNRWRRMEIMKTNPELGNEIMPKNILMIGPTGVGKTEIARRLAKLAQAPFIKVEATKFTEVGYVGRDVETIIRDLLDAAFKMHREMAMNEMRGRADDAAYERVLDILLPPPRNFTFDPAATEEFRKNETRQKFKEKIQKGEMDEQEIDVDLDTAMGVEIMGPPGMEEMTSQLSSMFQNLASGKKKTRKMKIKDALRALKEEEAGKMIDNDDIKHLAIKSAEQNGIVFIDEIDKIAGSREGRGPDVSREGVQRDLLPLIEGCTVSTKHGPVKTDHILFIASGAFHMSKPSDLVPELQGRLPIRVELKALSTDDFKRILTEPKASLTEQYIELLATENVKLSFADEGVYRIAEIAWQLNETNENIGARRLHTVIERLLEEVSFEASDMTQLEVKIDKAYVDKQLGAIIKDQDLSKYIL